MNITNSYKTHCDYCSNKNKIYSCKYKCYNCEMVVEICNMCDKNVNNNSNFEIIKKEYSQQFKYVNNFLDRIIESDVKNCLDYGYLFNNTLDKLENNNTGGFFHFSSVEEADKNMDIFKNHFKDIFTFGDRCCGGLGIQVRYTNGLKLL